MARKPPRLTLALQPAARRDLLQVWDYNVEQYGPSKADLYLNYLTQETARLETDYERGQPVPGRPDIRYLTFRKGRGHGHMAFYRITASTVEILRYLHTAQDWQGRADRGDLNP